MVTRAAKILTVSDGVVAGTREDRSGRQLADRLAAEGYEVVDRRTVADGVESVSDALAAMALRAAEDDAVTRVVICTPDKDLAQCVGDKVVQMPVVQATMRALLMNATAKGNAHAQRTVLQLARLYLYA